LVRGSRASYDGSVQGSWGLVVTLCGCEVVFPLGGGGDDGAAADAPALDAPAPVADAPVVRTDARADGPPPPDASVAGLCPSDYGTFGMNGFRYRPVLTLVPYLVAAADCADDALPGSNRYTHLVVLDDDLERSLVDATFQLPVAWIGLSDLRSEGLYRWVTLQDTMGYPPPSGPWAPNQPDDGGNSMNEDCIFIANPGAVLGDAECALGLRYVCECDLHMNAPSQYLPP
jgi:hypothetical protein